MLKPWRHGLRKVGNSNRAPLSWHGFGWANYGVLYLCLIIIRKKLLHLLTYTQKQARLSNKFLFEFKIILGAREVFWIAHENLDIKKIFLLLLRDEELFLPNYRRRGEKKYIDLKVNFQQGSSRREEKTKFLCMDKSGCCSDELNRGLKTETDKKGQHGPRCIGPGLRELFFPSRAPHALISGQLSSQEKRRCIAKADELCICLSRMI